MKFTALIDNGQGGQSKFQAENMEQAIEKASQWAKAGEWRMDGSVSVSVRNDTTGEKSVAEVTVEKSEVFAD